jgi:hypothetical protein
MLHNRIKQGSLILVLCILALIIAVQPAAAQINITVTGATGSCTMSVSVNINAILNDPTILNSTNFGIVLYDDNNNPFAFATISTGNTLTNLNLDLNYTELAQPAPGSMSGKLFALNAPANSVPGIEAGTLIATVSFDIDDLEACTGIALEDLEDLEIAVSINGGDPVPVFFDGRLNDFDSGSPIVIYFYQNDAGETGIQVYDTEGNLVLLVTPEAIAAIEECPEENTLILESELTGVALYRLASCEFQLMAPTGEPGKWYIAIFENLFNDTPFISFEEFILP